MALDKLVDSGALDTSLDSTAGILAAMLMNLAGLSGQAEPMPFDLANGTGFGAAILAFTNTYPLSGGTSASPADVSGGFAKASGGVFTLASAVVGGATHTITHNLGEIPDVVVIATPDINPSSAWDGLNNALVAIVAEWATAEKAQSGVRARTGTNYSGIISSGGLFYSDATTTQIVFTSNSNNTTGVGLAANVRYYWLAAKFAAGGNG